MGLNGTLPDRRHVGGGLWSPPFNPLLLTSWHAAFWAEDPTWTSRPTDSGSVSSWNDGSGNGRHATQGSSSAQPAFRIAASEMNGRPAINFLGNDYLDTSTWTDITGTTEIVVIGNSSSLTGSSQAFAHSPTSGKRRAVFWSSVASKWGIYGGGSDQTGTATPDTNPHIFRAVFDGSTGADLLYVDGVLDVNANAGSEASSALRIGSNTGLTQSLTGHIAFIAVKSGTLSTDERAQLDSWAASYYGAG